MPKTEILELLEQNNQRNEQSPYELSKILNAKKRKPFQFCLKRIIDIIGSLIGLTSLAPMFLIIAILIKLDSKGPVLFKQKRIGLNGKEFVMYKFRSMKKNADVDFETLKNKNQTNEGMFKLFDDPRITKLGKFLRKYSIDEFPQLLNVLIGDMSLVGFRPPIKRELSSYKDWHYIRFSMPPGITGMWQVNGRSNITDFDKVISLDYKYIKNWSLMLDFAILLKTIPVVIFAKDSA